MAESGPMQIVGRYDRCVKCPVCDADVLVLVTMEVSQGTAWHGGTDGLKKVVCVDLKAEPKKFSFSHECDYAEPTK